MKTQRLKYYLLGIFCLLSFCLQAQIPARPDPPRLVNDFAQVLTDMQRKELEQRLVAFNDTTSNQVVVVTVSTLDGYDRAQFAYEIGEKWGVGQEKSDNGVVILIKPKTENERGEAFIAPGYGLEGVLPDAICRRIVDEHMIPHFRNNDYYGGIVAALDIVLPLANGEYSEALENNGRLAGIVVLLIILFVVILLIVISKNGPRNLNSGNRGGDFWTGMMIGGMLGGSGRSHGGSWGGFSGGGGGFGGFGGGSFGGGGAGGSW